MQARWWPPWSSPQRQPRVASIASSLQQAAAHTGGADLSSGSRRWPGRRRDCTSASSSCWYALLSAAFTDAVADFANAGAGWAACRDKRFRVRPSWVHSSATFSMAHCA